jgi:hypothetical protein
MLEHFTEEICYSRVFAAYEAAIAKETTALPQRAARV